MGWARPGLRRLGLGALGTAIVEVSARAAPRLLAPSGMLLSAREGSGPGAKAWSGSSWPQAVTAYWDGKVALLGYSILLSTCQLSPPGLVELREQRETVDKAVSMNFLLKWECQGSYEGSVLCT